MKKISQLAKEETIEEVKEQVKKEDKKASLPPIHLSKTAGAMKDQYIKTLEEGYKPEDVKKYLTDITKPNADPSKVVEPKPKMSSDMESDVDTASSEIDLAL